MANSVISRYSDRIYGFTSRLHEKSKAVGDPGTNYSLLETVQMSSHSGTKVQRPEPARWGQFGVWVWVQVQGVAVAVVAADVDLRERKEVFVLHY